MTRRSYFVAHGGVVQGVGFRFFAKEKAKEHGVTGWCRNTPDNKVEGEAQGGHDALEAFLKEVGQGPAHAEVAQFTTEDRAVASGESDFSVRH